MSPAPFFLTYFYLSIYFYFLGRISYIPCWPQLTDPLASISGVLGLCVHHSQATTHTRTYALTHAQASFVLKARGTLGAESHQKPGFFLPLNLVTPKC